MANLNEEIIKEFEKNKIICVLRKVPMDKIIDTVEAMYKGGIRFVEVPFDQSDAKWCEVVAEEIKMLREHFGTKLHVGAGTVCTMKQVVMAYNAGAEIIVAPNIDVDVIKLTKELGLISMPGGFTASELQFAYKSGADFVKLFPTTGFNLKMAKEMHVPMNHIKMVYFGGVTPENFKEVLATGVVGVGIQSGIVNKEAIANGDFEKIYSLAKAYTSQLQ